MQNAGVFVNKLKNFFDTHWYWSVSAIILIYFIIALKIVFTTGPVGQDFGTVHLPNTQYVMKGHFIIEQSTETPLTYLLASLFLRAWGQEQGVRAFGVFCVLVNGFGLFILAITASKFISRSVCLLYLAFIATIPLFVITSIVFCPDALTFLPFYLYCWTALSIERETRIKKLFLLSTALSAIQITGILIKYTFAALCVPAAILIISIGVRKKLKMRIIVALLLIASIIPAVTVVSYRTYARARPFAFDVNNLRSTIHFFIPKKADIKLFKAPVYFKPITNQKGEQLTVDEYGKPDKAGEPGYQLLVKWRYSYFALLNLSTFTDILNITRKRFRDVNIYNSIVDSDVNRVDNTCSRLSCINGSMIFLLTWVAGLCLVIVQMFKKPFRNPQDPSLFKNVCIPACGYFFMIVGLMALMTNDKMLYHGYWLPRLVAPAIFSFFLLYFWLLEKFGHNMIIRIFMVILIMYQICVQLALNIW